MSTANDVAAAAQALTDALAAACANPADGVRLLSNLAVFTPGDPTTSSPIGEEMEVIQVLLGRLFRRAALTTLAKVSATYQPSSYDDAATVRDNIAGLLDAEALVAADAGDDASDAALRDLRAAVVADLTARGADLAPVETFEFMASLPAAVLAYRLYGDPSRADELIAEANPINPLFMPTTFQALAS